MSRNPNDNHLPITQTFLCNGNVARFNCVVTPDNLPGGRRPRLDKRPNFAEFSACRMRVILKQKGKAYFPRSCQLSSLSYRCHGGFHRLHILMKESLCNSVSHVTQLCDRFLSTNWHMGNRMTAISLQPTIRAHRWAAASALIPVRQRPARHARNEKGADIAVVARKLRCITMYFYIARP